MKPIAILLLCLVWGDAPRFRVESSADTSRRFTVSAVDARLPVMRVYTIPGCEPCLPVWADEASGKFNGRFRIERWDITERDPPFAVPTVPAFHWSGADGQGYIYPPRHLRDDQWGYPGANSLIVMWEATRQPRALPKARAAKTVQVTPQQQALINRALRAGFTMDQIMQYARANGLVK